MNSNIKKIIVIALILSLTAVAALYAQQAPANNGQGSSQVYSGKGANYDPNNPNCRLNGGSGMHNGQGAGYSQGYGKHSGARANGGVGCNNQAMLQTYGKYANDPDFAKMLQERDTLRQTHRKEALARSEAHRVEMRNISLSYAGKMNSAKTAAERTAVNAEMNKVLNEKRTAFRSSSATLRNAHQKQMTALDSKYGSKFPDYYKNKGTYGKGTGTLNCTGTGAGRGNGTGAGNGNGRGRGNGNGNGKGCPGC